jgi:hypothetical protein
LARSAGGGDRGFLYKINARHVYFCLSSFSSSFSCSSSSLQFWMPSQRNAQLQSDGLDRSFENGSILVRSDIARASS